MSLTLLLKTSTQRSVAILIMQRLIVIAVMLTYSKATLVPLLEITPKQYRLKKHYADAYNNRGVVYSRKGQDAFAIEDYNRAVEHKPDYADAYYNRGEAWLRLQEWEAAKTDLTTAKRKGMDIIAAFHNAYKDVETYEKRHLVKLPEGLAHLLTQRRRSRYPKTEKVLDTNGNPLESPQVVNLRERLRDTGKPLRKYLKTKPAFGINVAPADAFVVDKATRAELIAAHPSSAGILKPFLYGQDLRRWHVGVPHQWLIFAHRRIDIKRYPAILKHLEKHQKSLRKRKENKNGMSCRYLSTIQSVFVQPKLVCPDTYNHQTFAVDTTGCYYGKLGIESYRFVEICKGKTKFAFFSIDHAPISISFGIIWIDSYRLGVILNSNLEFAFPIVSIAAVVICFGIIRSKFYRLGIILNSSIKFFFITVNITSIPICFGRVWSKFYRFRAISDSSSKRTFFRGGHCLDRL